MVTSGKVYQGMTAEMLSKEGNRAGSGLGKAYKIFEENIASSNKVTEPFGQEYILPYSGLSNRSAQTRMLGNPTVSLRTEVTGMMQV